MNQYWAIAFILWSITLAVLGFEVRGWKDDASIEAAKDRQEIAVITKERKDETITNGVSNAYEKSVGAINVDYTALIRSLYGVPATGLPGVSKGPGRTHATACANQLSRAGRETLVDLEKQAQIQTTQLLFLQDWIRKQGMAQ